MGNAFLLIVAGLLLFYLVISDKWQCLEGFAGCVLGAGGSQKTGGNVSLPTLPTLPNTPTFTPTISYGYPDLTMQTNLGYTLGI